MGEVPRIGHSLETIKSTISSRCSLAHSTNQFPELCEGLDESSATNKVCLVTRRTNLRKGKEDAFWSFPYIARPQFLRASVHDLLRALSVRDLRGRNIVSLPYRPRDLKLACLQIVRRCVRVLIYKSIGSH